METRLGFIVDSNKCIGCNSCVMACKNFNKVDPDINWRKVHPLSEDAYTQSSRLSMSLACNHCANPQCLKACPVKAYTKREDGIVIQNHDRCIGCKMCIMACPYNVPQFNTQLKKVEKCHMCYERQDQGLKPGCVLTCPTGAIEVVDLNTYDLTGTVSSLPGFPNPKISNPSVRFIKPRIGVQVRRGE